MRWFIDGWHRSHIPIRFSLQAYWVESPGRLRIWRKSGIPLHWTRPSLQRTPVPLRSCRFVKRIHQRTCKTHWTIFNTKLTQISTKTKTNPKAFWCVVLYCIDFYPLVVYTYIYIYIYIYIYVYIYISLSLFGWMWWALWFELVIYRCMTMR